MHRILLITLLLPCSLQAELNISDAWIKNLPSSVPVRAGYMIIHNPQDHALSIVGASSEAFAAVEIHQTVMQDGMMRMEPLGEIKIEAGANLKLAPGGIHLMLMKPQSATRAGERITINLQLKGGASQIVEQQIELIVHK